ncbi:GNAT family N-acetyltransferase [Tsuneonella sp. HG222]
MADSIAVTRENETTHGAYKAPVPGTSREAELTWVARGDTRIANHTYVPQEARGKGIAAALVDALIEDARKEGFKVEPSCSYVEAAFRRHPEWADLRAELPS